MSSITWCPALKPYAQVLEGLTLQLTLGQRSLYVASTHKQLRKIPSD